MFTENSIETFSDMGYNRNNYWRQVRSYGVGGPDSPLVDEIFNGKFFDAILKMKILWKKNRKISGYMIEDQPNCF
jgi:hypothetical protein